MVWGKPQCLCGVSADSGPYLSLGDREVTSGSTPPPSSQATSFCFSRKEAGLCRLYPWPVQCESLAPF